MQFKAWLGQLFVFILYYEFLINSFPIPSEQFENWVMTGDFVVQSLQRDIGFTNWIIESFQIHHLNTWQTTKFFSLFSQNITQKFCSSKQYSWLDNISLDDITVQIASSDHQIRNKHLCFQYWTMKIPWSLPNHIQYRHSDFYSTFCKNVIPNGPLQYVDNQFNQMDSITRGGIPIAYQAYSLNPHKFQPDNDNTDDGIVDAVLYWKCLLINLQPM